MPHTRQGDNTRRELNANKYTVFTNNRTFERCQLSPDTLNENGFFPDPLDCTWSRRS